MTGIKIKVAIVDDHEFYRQGLIMALRHFKTIDVVFEATNGKDFIEKQKKNPADIVFMDLKMPVMDGYQTILESKKLFPDLRIVVLTMFEEEEYIQKSLAAGVQGYIIKNIDQDTLKTAIQRIMDGKLYFSNELMPFFAKKFNEMNGVSKSNSELTKRELEILHLIGEGLSNSEIAGKLFLSYRTIANHRASLKKKTLTKNTAELIRYGIKNRLLKP
jgi:DNA-binding NarL/FixJ family response regulator